MWGDDPPSSARHLVQVYVSQLRAIVGDGAIATHGGAYALAAEPEDVDAVRFRRLLDEAGSTGSVELYDAALALWRGLACDGIELSGAAAAEARRLEELRLTAFVARSELALAAGRHAELVPELQRLVTEEPLNERLRAQLMLALYRSGRQADALAVYRDTRRHFADELGMEPSPELRRLERAILEHDGALAAPASPAARAARRRPRRLASALAGAAAVAGLATAAAILGSAGSAGSRALAAGDVGIVDGASGRVLDTTAIGRAPTLVAVGRDSTWVGDGWRSAVVELDRATARRLRSVGLAAAPHSLVESGGTLWVADGFDGRVQRVTDGRASRPFRPTATSTGRVALAVGGGSVWAASQDGYLVAVDPRTARVRARIRVGLSNDIAADAHGLWVASATRDAILFVDPRTRSVRTIPIGGVPAAVTVGAGSIWAVTPDVGRVWRLNPSLRAVTASISAPTQAAHVAVAAGMLWISSRTENLLVGVDPKTDHVVHTVTLPEPPAAIAADGSRLWVALPK